MASKAVDKKILVVDDEADIRWSLQQFLLNKDLHAKVLTAASGEEALEELARERIDLVITDIRMPGISGLELLAEIKNRFPYLPVIVMTAYPSPEFARESALKGGMYFVEKPFDIKLLREKVNEALRDSGQFRGMLSGISLGDLIQIKCMSGVTAALRVREGKRQGVIFFYRGEIIHALCDELDGEEAFYEIISFAHGQLDTINIAELPKRTIFQSVAGLMLEGARRQDEKGTTTKNKPRKKSPPKAKAAIPREIARLDFAQLTVADKEVTRPLSLAELLTTLKRVEGYRAAAIIRNGGELVAQDASAGTDDLSRLGTAMREFFCHAGEATNKIGLGSCHEAVLWTRNEMLVMGQNTGGSNGELVLGVFGSNGNQALGRREMRKVMARLAVAGTGASGRAMN